MSSSMSIKVHFKNRHDNSINKTVRPSVRPSVQLHLDYVNRTNRLFLYSWAVCCVYNIVHMTRSCWQFVPHFVLSSCGPHVTRDDCVPKLLVMTSLLQPCTFSHTHTRNTSSVLYCTVHTVHTKYASILFFSSLNTTGHCCNDEF